MKTFMLLFLFLSLTLHVQLLQVEQRNLSFKDFLNELWFNLDSDVSVSQSTFSFEAGRRCESGEGSFEFDTKQGNLLFQAVEGAINLQRISLPPRQTSVGGLGNPDTPQDVILPPLPSNPPLRTGLTELNRTLPVPQPRMHIPQPPAAQVNSLWQSKDF